MSSIADIKQKTGTERGDNRRVYRNSVAAAKRGLAVMEKRKQELENPIIKCKSDQPRGSVFKGLKGQLPSARKTF